MRCETGCRIARVWPDTFMIATIIALSLLFLLPAGARAALFEFVSPPPAVSQNQAETPKAPAPQPKVQKEATREPFTIEGIQPDFKEKKVTITFSPSCTASDLRSSLKIFPPVRMQWLEDVPQRNMAVIKGDFRAATEYTVNLPDSAVCSGHPYRKTKNSFVMPDLSPEVAFAEKESVIERDSMQMLHVNVTNVAELRVKAFRIPPLLIHSSIAKMKAGLTFDRLRESLKGEYVKTVGKSLAEIDESFPALLTDFAEDGQVFFPERKKNVVQKFSVPLGFRSGKEKGAVGIVSLSGLEQGRAIQGPVRLFRITDMAMTYKVSRDSLLIWLTSLRSGEAMGDVPLFAFLKNGSVIPLGSTDEEGLLLLNNEEPKIMTSITGSGVTVAPVSIGEIELIVAASPDDATYVEIRQNGTIKPDWITQSPSPGEPLPVPKTHVYTERGIYRPGEQVLFKGTVREYRDGSVLPPQGGQAAFTVTNSKGEEVLSKSLPLSDFGTASGTIDLKSYFPLGTYTITVQYAGTSASGTFEVQEFRAPRHFVDLSFRKERVKDESYINIVREMDMLSCTVSGSYYAGGPVKQGKARWKVFLTGTDFRRTAYPDFTFGNVIETGRELIESGESMLDEKGNLTVRLPIGREIASGVYGIEFVATVVDFDGRAATRTSVYQTEPDYLVGISGHDSSVKAGESQVLRVIVVDRNGRRIERGSLDVQVMRQEYVYVRKRNDDGNVYWDDREVYQMQLSSVVSVEGGTATFEFDFMNGGAYLVKFIYKDKDGRLYSSSTPFNVEGYFYGYEYESRERTFERLAVAAERAEYGQGETMKIFLKPHRKISSLLMTVERDGILQHRTVTLTPGRSYVEIPVDKSFEPNVYLSFLGIVPRGEFPSYTGQFDEQAPAFLFGAVNVTIKRQVKQLSVKVNEDQPELVARPSGEFTLRVSAFDSTGKGREAEMTLCVVDESVLALTGFKTPSLETLTKFSAPLSVFTGDMRSDLLRQTPFRLIKNERLTGGGGGEGVDAPADTVRKDFRPVAYCNLGLRTDGNGRATVTFRLPDTMTTYRVYVVACDKTDQFASFSRGLRVVKDFYIEPGLPRFLTKGDRFAFSVAAFNKTEKAGEGIFSAAGDDHAKLSPEKTGFTMNAQDRQFVRVNGEALKTGVASLRFGGVFGGERDDVALAVPVRSQYQAWSDMVLRSFTGEGQMDYAFPETVMKPGTRPAPEDVKVTLTVSGSPFLRMTKALQYLLTYPYGCVEQTSSGIIPLSALRSLIAAGNIPDITVQETDKFLKPGIDRLLSMQTDRGGFSYWPGSRETDLWGSVYATAALTFAKRSGMDVPAERMMKALDYLTYAAREEGKQDSTFRGYVLYLLALNGRLDVPLFREVHKGLGGMSREGALLVLLAAHYGSQIPDSQLTEPVRALIEKKGTKAGRPSFSARYREPAIALLAGSVFMKDDPVTGRTAGQLLAGLDRRGFWTSTSDTGWALVALGEYFKDARFAREPFGVTVEQAGAEDLSAVIGPKETFVHELDGPLFLKNPSVHVTVDDEQEALALLTISYPRIDYAQSGYTKGFKIRKTIEQIDGSPTIRVGDVVKVKIDMEIDDDSPYIVLDDPLPAGLVAINTAIETEERVGPDGGEGGQAGEIWDYEGRFYRFMPNHFELRDDRVLAFRNQAWKGTYQYAYYARAVCEGEFVLPPTKVQLMYEPDVVSYTPAGKFVVKARE